MQHHIEKIAEIIDKGECVIFIGAGLSNNCGIPTGRDLAKKLARQLGRCEAEGINLPEWAEYFEVEFGRHELISFLKKEILIDIPEENRHPFNLISCIPFDTILTTNYDELAEGISSEYVTVKRNEEIWKIKSGQPIVVKIHSDLDDIHNVIITESDFYNYLNKFPNINSYLEYVFSSKCILFIGFGLNDINTNNILYWTRKTQRSSRKSYAVIKNIDPLRKKVLENRGLIVVDHDGTDFLEKLAHKFFGTESLETAELIFQPRYIVNRLRRGENTQIEFNFKNNGSKEVTLLTYQFEGYHENNMVGTYKKHLYDEQPNVIPPGESLTFLFNKVNPLVAYFKSRDFIGQYESRITIEYVYQGEEILKAAHGKASLTID